mmetsp:Transcript_52894/g.149979  ORF Transcript_52894/g.149979 Transcript_52894/m.149979 type:complete len:272 (+) Transcript_52894:556-1371(+)
MPARPDCFLQHAELLLRDQVSLNKRASNLLSLFGSQRSDNVQKLFWLQGLHHFPLGLLDEAHDLLLGKTSEPSLLQNEQQVGDQPAGRRGPLTSGRRAVCTARAALLHIIRVAFRAAASLAHCRPDPEPHRARCQSDGLGLLGGGQLAQAGHSMPDEAQPPLRHCPDGLLGQPEYWQHPHGLLARGLGEPGGLSQHPASDIAARACEQPIDQGPIDLGIGIDAATIERPADPSARTVARLGARAPQHLRNWRQWNRQRRRWWRRWRRPWEW